MVIASCTNTPERKNEIAFLIYKIKALKDA
jgi:hypothetical protein